MFKKAPSPLEKSLGYTFKDAKLMVLALTHASAAKSAQAKNNKPDNERLEFLGDAILSAIVAEELYKTRPADAEGSMTQARAQLTQGVALSALARKLGVEAHLIHANVNAKGSTLERLLEQAIEALIGAIFLEVGFDKTAKLVRKWLSDNPLETTAPFNPKGALQEILQPDITVEQIEYRLASQEGPDHNRSFTVELWVAGKLVTTATAPSKKAAQEAAAAAALAKFRK